MFTENVIKHFLYPENAGILEDADGIGEAGTTDCGDYLVIYIKVGRKGEREYIEDIKFQVYGCFGAIATSSMTTVLAKGKTLEEAMNITEGDVIEGLGGLSEDKEHCSVLGPSALREAIKDYYSKKCSREGGQ